MPINGCSIADIATSLSVVGGSAQVFTPDGVTVNNGVHVAANAVQDFRVRPHATFVNKVPQRKADGSWTMGTRTIKSTEPWLDTTTGIVHYVSCDTTIRFSPVIPAATFKNARYKHLQFLFDSETENFNANGDLS